MKIKIKIESIDKVMWTFFMFMFIFGPPIVPYPQLILAAFSTLLLLTNYRGTTNKVLAETGASHWGIAMIVWLAYSFSIPLFVSLLVGDLVNTNNYTQIFNRYMMLVITVIPCTCVFLSYIEKHKLKFDYFVECIIGAGLLEAICSILAFISPSIKSLFISIMGRSGGRLYANNWYITVRAYGFASTLIDLFGLGIAIIAGISYIYGTFYKKRYIFFSIVIAFATALNSRTGILLYVIAIAISTFYFMKTNKNKVKAVAIAIGALIFIGAFVSIGTTVIASRSATYQWIDSGIKQVLNFLNSRESSDMTLFRKNSWELPDFFRTIIGTGHSLYRAEGYKQSDIGYINELWISGVLGCVWLYWTQIKLSRVLLKGNNELYKIGSIMILLCFFVFNIKGAALGYNPGGTAMITMLFGMRYFLTQDEESYEHESTERLQNRNQYYNTSL